MLHYYAERMFSPVMLSPVKTNQTHFRVHIVSNKRYVMISLTDTYNLIFQNQYIISC